MENSHPHHIYSTDAERLKRGNVPVQSGTKIDTKRQPERISHGEVEQRVLSKTHGPHELHTTGLISYLLLMSHHRSSGWNDGELKCFHLFELFAEHPSNVIYRNQKFYNAFVAQNEKKDIVKKFWFFPPISKSETQIYDTEKNFKTLFHVI